MARKKDENNYPLQTIITRDAAAYLAKLAKEDDRSMVKYAKRVIMEHLKANGYVENSTIQETSKNELKKEHIEEKTETQKKSSSSAEQVKEIKQPANCIQSSVTRTRSKNTKVAAVPVSFVK